MHGLISIIFLPDPPKNKRRFPQRDLIMKASVCSGEQEEIESECVTQSDALEPNYIYCSAEHDH